MHPTPCVYSSSHWRTHGIAHVHRQVRCLRCGTLLQESRRGLVQCYHLIRDTHPCVTPAEESLCG